MSFCRWDLGVEATTVCDGLDVAICLENGIPSIAIRSGGLEFSYSSTQVLVLRSLATKNCTIAKCLID